MKPTDPQKEKEWRRNIGFSQKFSALKKEKNNITSDDVIKPTEVFPKFPKKKKKVIEKRTIEVNKALYVNPEKTIRKDGRFGFSLSRDIILDEPFLLVANDSAYGVGKLKRTKEENGYFYEIIALKEYQEPKAINLSGITGDVTLFEMRDNSKHPQKKEDDKKKENRGISDTPVIVVSDITSEDLDFIVDRVKSAVEKFKDAVEDQTKPYDLIITTRD